MSTGWPADRSGERVTALIQADFGGYDVDCLIPSFTANPARWLAGAAGLAFRHVDWPQAGAQLALFGMILLTALAVVVFSRRRSLYRPIAGVVAIWPALAPLSPALQAQAIDKQSQAFQVLQGAAAEGEETPALVPLDDRSGGISAAALRQHQRDPGHAVQPVSQSEKPLDVPFDTARSPMETGRAAAQVRQAAGYFFDTDPAARDSAAAAATDVDEDGLDDSLEAI